MKVKDDSLKELILDINNSNLNYISRNLVNIAFELSPHPILLTDLSGWIGALIVRAILYRLGVNEHHIFKWRPENKYIQYLILNHYSRGCMPKTMSLTALLKKDEWVESLRGLIKFGYFIKATLGFGSGRTKSFDRTTDLEQILRNHKYDDLFKNEKWIIQKRLKLNKEFRIHTFGKDILYGLTFRISGTSELKDFDQPQEFVYLILQKLPSSFIEGSMIGWDIGLTKKGKYYVIEANFTGFHPEYHCGFQTTGYVDDPPFGSIVCAWLHTYFRNKYAISIASVESILMEKFPYLEEFFYYISILKNEHIEALIKAKGRVNTVYIYLDENTDVNMIRLVSYMQIAHFADKIYIITNQELVQEAQKIFTGDNLIHLPEHSLFTEDQYKKVQLLDDENKKKMCFSNLMKMTTGQSYIFI